MLEVSVFYLEKQKSFIPKKKYFLGRSQYQNKKALFTGPIFSDGFDLPYTLIDPQQALKGSVIIHTNVPFRELKKK